jgi:tRNA U34 5-carboxymethylaminomethyl modifying GTPase MnmE/TrmE
MKLPALDTSSIYTLSCSTGQGLAEFEGGLVETVKKMFSIEASSSEGALITRERHRRHLREAVEHLNNFLEESLPMDLAAEELRSALSS